MGWEGMRVVGGVEATGVSAGRAGGEIGRSGAVRRRGRRGCGCGCGVPSLLSGVESEHPSRWSVPAGLLAPRVR